MLGSPAYSSGRELGQTMVGSRALVVQLFKGKFVPGPKGYLFSDLHLLTLDLHANDPYIRFASHRKGTSDDPIPLGAKQSQGNNTSASLQPSNKNYI